MQSLRDKVVELRSLSFEQQERDLLEIIAKYKEILIDLNTSQLNSGIDSKGKSLGEYKSQKYAEFKRTLNPKGVVDLKLEGDWQDSIFLETQSFPVIFNASNWKTPKLIDNFGDDILGITEENLDKTVDDYLLEDVQAYYRRKLSFV